MGRKQFRIWDGMKSIFRLLLFLLLLFVIFPMFVNPSANPFYVGNRSNERRVSCQSNMKQFGLALIQYSQDADNTLPNYETADGHGWREAIYPYTRSVGVYRCPDDNRNDLQYTPDNLPKSYTANAAIMTGDKAEENPRTIEAVDTRGYDGEDWNMTNPAFLPSSGRELYAHLPRHLFYKHPRGGVNFLFADSHVRWLAPMATLTPVNLWTRDNAPFTGRDLANAQAILKHAGDE